MLLQDHVLDASPRELMADRKACLPGADYDHVHSFLLHGAKATLPPSIQNRGNPYNLRPIWNPDAPNRRVTLAKSTWRKPKMKGFPRFKLVESRLA